MKYFSIILFLILIISCSQKNTLKNFKDTNFNLLPVFSFNQVGDGGEYTEEYKSIWLKSKESNANELFINMLGSQNPATRLYGLTGLKIIQSTLYSKYYQTFITDNSSVFYSDFGCMFFAYKSSDVASLINNAKLNTPFNFH